jgi:hypothetical protein
VASSFSTVNGREYWSTIYDIVNYEHGCQRNASTCKYLTPSLWKYATRPFVILKVRLICLHIHSRNQNI